MYRRSTREIFKNSKDIGSYLGVCFEITGHTELGKESIFFDTDIHYIDKGKGQPILFIHGIGQSLYTWRKSIDIFARNGYRVLAVDLAGFGYSGHPNIYYTPEEYALIIKAFLDTLGIDKVNIAAFSTGCLSAICLAAANPERIGKLIFVSPGAPNSEYLFTMRFLTTWLGYNLFRLHLTESSVRKILLEMYFDSTLVTDDVIDNYFRPFLNKDVRETLAMCMAHFDDAYPKSLLRGIKHDTLIFSGADDKIHNENMIIQYTRPMPNATHIRLRNCSHLLHEEKYAKFN
ncbi:MAG: alpha/beta fold hydrolase, partial [Christensenellales bacterium]